jgi:hypothetical protein
MSSTAPTPDGASGKTPAPQPQGSPPTPSTTGVDSLNKLTSPTREPITQRIMGQRLIIDYQTTERGGREILESARVYLIPPFGSSSLISRPYTIQTHSDDRLIEARLITLLNTWRDRCKQPQDQEILNGLTALMCSTKGIKILHEQTETERIRREVPIMTYLPPRWECLESELRSLTSTYLCSRIQNGLYQECTCRIDPKRNALTITLSEAECSISPKNLHVIEACKELPSGLSKIHAQEHAWRGLKNLAERVMRTFRTYGLRCVLADLKNALPPGSRIAEDKVPQSPDERLRLGIVRDYAPDKIVELPGGGKAILEVGDEAAALCIFSTEYDGCSSYSLVLDARKLPDIAFGWYHYLAQIHAAMDSLTTTSAIGLAVTLERLRENASYEFDRRCSASHLIGEPAARLFSSLSAFEMVNLWLPNTSSVEGRLQLVQGYERAEISLAHIPGEAEDLAAFSSLTIVFGPNGSLHIEAQNQLNNRLNVFLSAESIRKMGGYGAVVSDLGLALSTRNVREAHSKLHQLLARWVAADPTNSHIEQSVSKSDYMFPPNSSIDRKPYDLASDITQLAHGVSRGFGNHGAAWIDDSQAVAVVDYLPGLYIIHFQTDEDSITSVRLEGKPFYLPSAGKLAALPSLNFTIDKRTSKILVDSLPELLDDYVRFSERLLDGSLQDGTIQGTKLFALLKRHGGTPPSRTGTPS